MLLNYCFFLSSLVWTLSFSYSGSTPLAVNTTAGIFQGLRTGNGTERWLGIPFAQPPVGSLRFKSPVAISRPSSKVQNASSFKDACPQPPDPTIGAAVSEDCLGLNVSTHYYL